MPVQPPNWSKSWVGSAAVAPGPLLSLDICALAEPMKHVITNTWMMTNASPPMEASADLRQLMSGSKPLIRLHIHMADDRRAALQTDGEHLKAEWHHNV